MQSWKSGTVKPLEEGEKFKVQRFRSMKARHSRNVLRLSEQAVPRYNRGVRELSRVQTETLERLLEAGFRPIAIPPYENALCVHRGECVAVLTPVENGGWRLLAPATWMVDGNFSVRLKRPGGDVFVWKKTEVGATEERLRELEMFREELEGILESHKL